MADFILVHGGLHGAACWDLLRPELERLGHTSFAMDMPIDEPGLYMDGYADAVVASLAGRPTRGAYLVGHSMGGMVIPRVAAKLLETRLIFLCAGFANTSEAERLESMDATTRDFFGWLIADPEGRVRMSRENAVAAFYPDVAPDIADWAVSRLRPQWAEAFNRVNPIEPYTEKVAHVVYTTGDRIIDPEKHRRMSEVRFGVTPIPLPGGHSPFLSHPAALAWTLHAIVRADQAGTRYAPNS